MEIGAQGRKATRPLYVGPSPALLWLDHRLPPGLFLSGGLFRIERNMWPLGSFG